MYIYTVPCRSIHLCNNCIQKNYSNSELRADALPEENMWDSDTFQDYLRYCVDLYMALLTLLCVMCILQVEWSSNCLG